MPETDGEGRDNHPVIEVDWDDATAYAEYLTKQTGRIYRLPTEAEWEYAARAGTRTDYWWGNEIGKNKCNCDGSGSISSDHNTSPVGTFEPNPWGVYDTVGNVWEWVHDLYSESYYSSSLPPNRVNRGGGWFSTTQDCRVSKRYRYDQSSSNYSLGFRVARTS